MIYLFGYFLVGAFYSMWLYREGMYQRVAIAAQQRGVELESDTIILAIAICGVFLYPLLFIAYVLNGFRH